MLDLLDLTPDQQAAVQGGLANQGEAGEPAALVGSLHTILGEKRRAVLEAMIESPIAMPAAPSGAASRRGEPPGTVRAALVGGVIEVEPVFYGAPVPVASRWTFRPAGSDKPRALGESLVSRPEVTRLLPSPDEKYLAVVSAGGYEVNGCNWAPEAERVLIDALVQAVRDISEMA